MEKPNERERRFAEMQRALDESDREESTKAEDDVEALARTWEKVVSKDRRQDRRD